MTDEERYKWLLSQERWFRKQRLAMMTPKFIVDTTIRLNLPALLKLIANNNELAKEMKRGSD